MISARPSRQRRLSAEGLWTASPPPLSLRTRYCGSSLDALTSRPPASVSEVILRSTTAGVSSLPCELHTTLSPFLNSSAMASSRSGARPPSGTRMDGGTAPRRRRRQDADPHWTDRSRQRPDGCRCRAHPVRPMTPSGRSTATSPVDAVVGGRRAAAQPRRSGHRVGEPAADLLAAAALLCAHRAVLHPVLRVGLALVPAGVARGRA